MQRERLPLELPSLVVDIEAEGGLGRHELGPGGGGGGGGGRLNGGSCAPPLGVDAVQLVLLFGKWGEGFTGSTFDTFCRISCTCSCFLLTSGGDSGWTTDTDVITL